jgi:pyruvate,water dikinase
MRLWRRESRETRTRRAPGGADRVRAKYQSFRELLATNNECLEMMAGLQEDLQFVPPRRDVLGERIGQIFAGVEGVVRAMDSLTGVAQDSLHTALASQQAEIERFTAGPRITERPRVSLWLSEVTASSEQAVGGKAAMLGEIRNKLGLPVPDGFALTTEAYREYCGIPLWQEIRDATRDLDLNDLDAVRQVAERLTRRAMECPASPAIAGSILARAQVLLRDGGMLAVRSSGLGEGGAKSCAGQFLSLLNVPADGAVEAYRQVIAARFSERALVYRLSTGLLEVDTPMAVLFLPVLAARSSGIMYTRDPADPKSKNLWITATRGLGLDIASGKQPADMFVVRRARPHLTVERNLVRKAEEIVSAPGGGIANRPLPETAQLEPSLQDHLHTLAEWGILLEEHFKAPQDVEWVLDDQDRLWIVQSRALVPIDAAASKSRAKPKVEPCLTGGRTVSPGRTSGRAFLVNEIQDIVKAPEGAVVFIRKPVPEIVEVFPRIAGLVAEWGNLTGHAAALLREFRIPSVFHMSGAFERLTDGQLVSLDAVQPAVYPGVHWPARRREAALTERYHVRRSDPIWQRLLTLNLLDPAADNFRPSGCRSAHDILRYCHENAIGAMFAVNDVEMEQGVGCARHLTTPLPLNILVMDLGGGVAAGAPADAVAPSEIVSRPFQALWKGLSYPGVTWTRETMPAHISDLASVLASSFTPQSGAMRPLGEKSYLLVADEYMNLNSRLAYHYSLVDACLSDIPGNTYISFRFEGGGASRDRRSLRACFIERCLRHHGFQVDRRGDLVNAWYRKAPVGQIEERLDMLGRLMACSSQLDMFMTSRGAMNWYADQFIAGNYSFEPPAGA